SECPTAVATSTSEAGMTALYTSGIRTSSGALPHRNRQPSEGIQQLSLVEAAETWRWEDSGYVFTRKDGSALNPSTLTWAFRWIVDQSELPRIRLHDLRHTHASIAVKAGVPIGVVSERLGHASPEFTLHRYSHVMPGMQREAADAVARDGAA
ncbi:MAG: tyrosine-type recombinase/integrase, partial [Acidimicrobiia bacterium]